MPKALRQFVSEEEGADALEYGLIASVIFLVIIGAVTSTATQTTGMFTTLTNAMGGA